MTFLELNGDGGNMLLAIAEIRSIRTVKVAVPDEHGRATDAVYNRTQVTLKNGEEFRTDEAYMSLTHRLRLMGEVP